MLSFAQVWLTYVYLAHGKVGKGPPTQYIFAERTTISVDVGHRMQLSLKGNMWYCWVLHGTIVHRYVRMLMRLHSTFNDHIR